MEEEDNDGMPLSWMRLERVKAIREELTSAFGSATTSVSDLLGDDSSNDWEQLLRFA
jgi:hypothetical protein